MNSDEIDLSPTSIDCTFLDDTYIHHIVDRPYTTIVADGSIPLTTIPFAGKNSWKNSIDMEWQKWMREKEESKMDFLVEHFKNRYVACCNDILDLSQERVLTTLSAIKGRLMAEVSPMLVKSFECKMTPTVRNNIIQASKKLKMYGKKQPIIARFDDYGNRLPDELDLGTSQGITLKIVDPDDYGQFYLEMTAFEFPNIEDIVPF